MRRHTSTTLALAAAVALGLSACGDGTATPIGADTEPGAGTTTEAAPSAGTGSATAEPSDRGGDPAMGRELSATCEAEEYTIAYPGSWQQNPGGTLDPCRVFHPEEIEVEPAQDGDLHWAVRLYIDPVPFEQATEGDSRDEELSRETTTVAGRDAVVLETRSSGRGIVPEGEQAYRYIVDLGDDRILVATTYTVGDTDYDADRSTLDGMMDTLELASS